MTVWCHLSGLLWGFCAVVLVGQVQAQWNSEPSLTATGQYSGGGSLFVVASVASGKKFKVISSDSAFTNSSIPYKCQFQNADNSAQSITTTAKFIDTGNLECPFPDWGLLYGSAIAVLSVQKDSTAVEVIGDAVEIYFQGTSLPPYFPSSSLFCWSPLKSPAAAAFQHHHCSCL
eukprot:2636406-Rhodomonas_salina.3